MIEKFCEHFDVISGYAFKSADLKDDGDIPVIKIGNISSGANVVEDSNTQYVSKDFLKINEKYHIKKDDILISLTGSHINQPNSMVGRVCRNYRDRIYLLNQRAGKVIPKKIESRDYIFYLLSSKCIKEDIANRAYGAANQVNISSSAIGNIKWDFPSIDMQKKIGDVLSSFDNLIETNNKRIKMLEKMAENLYKEWFVRFRFPGYETAEFVDGVPKGWKREHIEYFYDTSSGGTPSRSNERNYIDGTIPWIKTGEIKDTIIVDTDEHITDLALKNSSAKLFPKDTVIMAMYGVNIGKLGYLGDNMACNQAACVFVDKSTINSKHYLFQLLKSMREYLLNIGFGAAQQNLSQQLINKIKIT